MLLTIPDLLDCQQLQQCRRVLDQAQWHDGRTTAGDLARAVKTNEQLPQDSAACRQLGEVIMAALSANPTFMSAALPLKVLPPRFNRYQGGGAYGEHIDNAVFSVPGTPHRVRSDLSATVFLNGPDEYEGGELVIQDTYGSHEIKLPAGHMVLYPGTSLHHVNPVDKGARLASFFWIQSLVREDHLRALMYELDAAIQDLRRRHGDDDPASPRLIGVYHNLLRQWAQT